MAERKGAKVLREEIVAIDIGVRMTKAVCLRRRGTELVLTDATMLPTPEAEKALSVETLAGLLRQTVKALRTSCRHVVVTLRTTDSTIAYADLPHTSMADLRKMISLSPKSYLQQDLPGHVFDCFFRKTAKGADTTSMRRRKAKVLVAGARRTVVEDWREAARQAGVILAELTVAPVALANAFRLLRDDSHPDPAAVLDIGASNSIIGIIHHGDLVLSRSVALGSDKFADVLSPEGQGGGAEPESAGSTETMQHRLQGAILAFAREVDASAGFYTSQHEKHISQLFVSGGTARSQFVLQMLESELSCSCEPWNLIRQLTVELPEQRARELEYEMAQFTVAVGAAVGALRQDSICVNLLAEEQELADARRRDPVRRGIGIAAGVVILMLAWAAVLGVQVWKVRREVAAMREEVDALKGRSGHTQKTGFQVAGTRNRVERILAFAKQRFLAAPVLGEMQAVVPPEMLLKGLELAAERSVERLRATNATSKPRLRYHEEYVLTLKLANYATATEMRRFVEGVPEREFFKAHLATNDAVRLLHVGQPQSDPDPERRGVSFEPFTVQFRFRDRVELLSTNAAKAAP